MNPPPAPPAIANCATPDRPCGLVIPSLGMASCRGRAEAFARRLQSKLRTLGSQSDESPTGEEAEDTLAIETDQAGNSWLTQKSAQTVTNLQPLRNDVESFYDFDCDLESPGSPVDECEYSRLIETASNTPLGTSLSTGFTSTPNTDSKSQDSNNSSSSEDPFFDSDQPPQNGDFFDCEDAVKLAQPLAKGINGINGINGTNGLLMHAVEVQIESLPQEAAESLPAEDCSACIQNAILDDLHKQSQEVAALQNGHEPVNGVEPEAPDIATPTVTSPEDKPTEEDTNGQQNDDKHLSAVDTEEEDDCRPQRVRRCSSLKTGKTPPGTPGRKKIVRFADALGLDLADVKTFLDEIPTIPKSAFEDLEIAEAEPPIQLGPKPEKLLMPLFQQPGGLPSFLDIVREKYVVLENAAVIDHMNLTITGCARVRNLDFNKSVHIRYTLDNWRSYADLQCNYVENSCDGFSDKFTFVLFGNSLAVGQRLEFAVRFQCKGQQFWDSNYGANYCFQCLPATAPAASIRVPPPSVVTTSHHTANGAAILSPSAGDAWCGSFY